MALTVKQPFNGFIGIGSGSTVYTVPANTIALVKVVYSNASAVSGDDGTLSFNINGGNPFLAVITHGADPPQSVEFYMTSSQVLKLVSGGNFQAVGIVSVIELT